MNRILAIVLLLSVAALAHAQGKGDVRIYRCTDAAGKQTLRDTPCPKGQTQQTRDMLRPKDAPRATRPAAPAMPTTTTPPPQVVYLAPPQPLYECVTDEGRRYTSENGDGNPRWVPLWTLGYPAYGGFARPDAGRGVFRPAPSVNASVGRPQQTLPASTAYPPPRHGHPVPWPVASGGGTWIRDACALLPPRETCARLRDRRAEIRTRFFNAMPSERDVLRAEERGINARLDNDCGGH